MHDHELGFLKILNQKRTKKIIACSLIGLWGFFSLEFGKTQSYLCFADSSPSPTPTAELGIDDYEQICKDSTSKSNSESSMKASYCSAAKTSKEGYSAYHSTWRVWAAVSVVCGGACVSSFAGMGNPYICAASNISAAAADAVIVKNFESALMSIGGTLMGLMINQQMNPSSPSSPPSPEEKKKTSKDYNACLSAANAAFQSFSSYNSMKSNLNSLKSNLSSALATEGESKTALSADHHAEVKSTTGSTSGGVSSSSAVMSAHPSNPLSPGTSLCGTTLVSNEVSSVYACALASDPNLPKSVTSPKFSDDFKKIAGNDLSQFINTSTSPGHAISSSIGHILPSTQAESFTNSMNTLEQQVASRDLIPASSLSYSSGEGKWGRSGNSEESNLNDLMNTMMGQFMPKADDKSASSQSGIINFGAWEKLSPTAKSENRKFSIFDRISYQYFKVQSGFGVERN